MYFPFLRGKQNELYAINELASKIKESKKVIPIFEPTNLNSTTRRVLPEINNAQVPYVLIINPRTGDLVNRGFEIYRSLLDATENKSLITLGYFISDTTTKNEIQQVLTAYSQYKFAFIHIANSPIKDNLIQEKTKTNFHIFIEGKVSTSYMKAFDDQKKVLIQDPFVRLPRNADYRPDEYYSDLFNSYLPRYYGFGDYQIVGAGVSGGTTSNLLKR